MSSLVTKTVETKQTRLAVEGTPFRRIGTWLDQVTSYKLHERQGAFLQTPRELTWPIGSFAVSLNTFCRGNRASARGDKPAISTDVQIQTDHQQILPNMRCVLDRTL